MVTYSTETITPQMAREYLQKNVGNRNLSKEVVKIYASEMKNGKWKLNAQTISFTDDGYLVDGQHRLQACILANVPFTTSVVRGVDKEVFSSIDCGRNRVMGQLVGMQGVKHYNQVASTFGFAQQLISGYRINDRIGKKKRVGYTNVEKMEMFEQDKDGYVEAAHMALRLGGSTRLLETSIVGGTIYYLNKYCGYNLDFIRHFFEGALSLSSSTNPSIEKLRQRLIREKCEIRKSPKGIVYALLIKAWNSYVTGNPVKCLRFDENKEDYPEFITYY